MIRIAIVEDHPAVGAGLTAIMRGDADLDVVGLATEPEGLAPLIYRTRPDVVLLDYRLPRRDGLSLCRALKADVPAPGVVLYTAFATDALTIPALLAGADAIVDKATPAAQLRFAIRLVAGGESVLPAVGAEQVDAAARALDPEDVPILAMLVQRIPQREIAAALACEEEEIRGRIDRMLSRLAPAVL